MEMPGWRWMLLVLLLGAQPQETCGNRDIGQLVSAMKMAGSA
jgi:hypothetical protein